MRITHVISSMDPNQGGPPVVVANLAQAQADLGHTISIGCEHPTATSASFSVFQLPTIRFPFPTSRCSFLDTDVVHMHGVWEPVLPCVAREARRHGIPYLVAPHGMLDPWSLQQSRWKKKLALALGYRRMLNRAAALHVLNEDEGRLIEPLGIQSPRVVIPNGISVSDLQQSPDPAHFRAHPKGPGGAPYVLFLSRLHYKKGLDYLADAFAMVAKQHPELVLVVVGPDGGAEASFRDQIEKLGLTSRLRMPGPLFGADKWSAIAGASVFCLPSRQEGFSVAILEAMACRVPVVVSDACHFPEVAQVGAGQVVPLDASAVANAIGAILSNPQHAKAMGEAGRKLVEERFTWPKVAARTIEVYERLVKGRSVS